jgi:hypothetical protein
MPDWIGPSSDNPMGGGYNAIFIPLGETRTLSEIPPEEAIDVGYREPNFCALVTFLRARSMNRQNFIPATAVRTPASKQPTAL